MKQSVKFRFIDGTMSLVVRPGNEASWKQCGEVLARRESGECTGYFCESDPVGISADLNSRSCPVRLGVIRSCFLDSRAQT